MIHNNEITKRKIAKGTMLVFSAVTLVLVLVGILFFKGKFRVIGEVPSSLEHSSIIPSMKLWGDSDQYPEFLCIKGIKYLYLRDIFIGGLAPVYDLSHIATCSENKFNIGKNNFFHPVCYKNILYYQINNPKGAALSVAYDATGKPLKCTMLQELKK